MAMQRRASGVLVEARGGTVVASSPLRIRRARLGELVPAAPAGGRRRAAPPPPPMTEEEAIVNAMEAQDLLLLDAIPVAPGATGLAAGQRRRTRATPAAAAVAGAARVDLAVPLAEGQSAVVLVDNDGVYSWRLPDLERAPTPEEAPPRRGRGAAAPAAAVPPARTMVFRIELAAPPAVPPGAVRRASRRGGLLTKVLAGKAVVYVFRFIARPVLQGAAKFLERHVSTGLVHLRGPEPQQWVALADDAPVQVPADRAARVLMLVHGTFSSTVGSFGSLAGQPDGRTLLEAALKHYDLVIGWDHRTLSELPSENAIAFAARLERIGFSEPPLVDAVSFSRGGLVLRSLVEQVMPSSALKLRMQRAIFVAATNGGTELANPQNWHRLADRYTNLAAAGARAAALVPAFAATGTILAAAIRGIGILVKLIATSAVTDQAVPGLAAMEPEGDFVREINGTQPGQPTPEQTYYCAVTSNFDPETASTQVSPEVMPPGLLLQLADKATDALHGQPNDLVVHVASMTQIDEKVGAFIRERYDFGTNGLVHHCSYFSQPETARQLLHWLQLEPAAVPAAARVAPGVAPQVVKLRSTQSAAEALARVRHAKAPWIVIERPVVEAGQAKIFRYAHPAQQGTQWLREFAKVRGATVHEAFGLHEAGRSREAPMGAGVGAAERTWSMPRGLPAVEARRNSALRTITMAHGEPVGVLAPPALPGAGVRGRPAVPPFGAPTPWTGPMRMAPAAPLARAPAVGASATRGTQPRPRKPAATAAAEVACHFRAETDDEYVLEQVHTVVVTIAREVLQATRRASKTASAQVKKAKPLIVECMPMLRVSLEDPDNARVEIPVPDPGTPASLRFDLKANEVGAAQVQVQVRQGPLPLATMTLDLMVVPARSGTRRPVVAGADLAQLPDTLPRATDELRIVQMQPYGQKTQYRYELRLPSVGVQEGFESPVLDSDPGAYVASIHKRIEDRWTEHGSEKKAFARDLRAIGCELFDELFPAELKQLLWQHRQDVRSVQVLSTEPFIPWELVLLHDPAVTPPGSDAAFLGELGVVRWLVYGYPPETVRMRPEKLRYLVPAYPPPNDLPGAQQEIALLQGLGATPVAAEAEAVYGLIEQPGQFDLLHVACHGATDAADIGSARLLMPGKPRADGSLSEEDVLATTVRHTARLRQDGERPVVVLNACQSGRAGYTLKGLGGFAEAFIRGGAGVFVGSSWSIGDTPAQAFVQEFYRQFIERGKPLAAAAAAARTRARDDGDATWLAYVVYGHPRARARRT